MSALTQDPGKATQRREHSETLSLEGKPGVSSVAEGGTQGSGGVNQLGTTGGLEVGSGDWYPMLQSGPSAEFKEGSQYLPSREVARNDFNRIEKKMSVEMSRDWVGR